MSTDPGTYDNFCNGFPKLIYVQKTYFLKMFI